MKLFLEPLRAATAGIAYRSAAVPTTYDADNTYTYSASQQQQQQQQLYTP